MTFQNIRSNNTGKFVFVITEVSFMLFAATFVELGLT